MIQFTLQNLVAFIISVLGVVAGVFLVSILWNVSRIVRSLRPVVEANQGAIDKAIGEMPGMLENLGQISSDVRETASMLRLSVPVILQEVEGVTKAARGSLELAGTAIQSVGSGITEVAAGYRKDPPGFMDYLHIFEEIVQSVYRTLSSTK